MLLGILAIYFEHQTLTGFYSFDITRFHGLDLPARSAVVGVSRTLPGFCRQGADVPVSHLAAGCAH